MPHLAFYYWQDKVDRQSSKYGSLVPQRIFATKVFAQRLFWLGMKNLPYMNSFSLNTWAILAIVEVPR